MRLPPENGSKITSRLTSVYNIFKFISTCNSQNLYTRWSKLKWLGSLKGIAELIWLLELHLLKLKTNLSNLFDSWQLTTKEQKSKWRFKLLIRTLPGCQINWIVCWTITQFIDSKVHGRFRRWAACWRRGGTSLKILEPSLSSLSK